VSIIEIARIQVRRGQENITGIPQLAPGEFGWAQDTENLYIGKRIVEGANTDENSRILTQKDYDNLFAIVMGAGRTAVASTSTYRYRDNLDYLVFQSTTTFVGIKLDATVSLVDFGVNVSSTATDIYPQLTQAINNLFANDLLGSDARRQLKIPAGNYYISNTIELPPFTTLIGEGSGMTHLIPTSNNFPIFKTVDANGTTFESTMANQQSGAGSKNIILEGMSLVYNTTSTSTMAPLISLDNTENSVLRDIEFKIVRVVNTSTGTILINTSTIYGVGLSLRGERRSGVEQNKNVVIDNCKFKNIGLGVLGTGTVAYSKIENCLFSELQQGINFSAFDGDTDRLAPTESTISKNIFENIINQAVYVGTSTNQVSFVPNILNHSSNNNIFYRVGNGPDLGDGITSNTGTAVITNYGVGFTSHNDKFSRREFANPNFDNPLSPKPTNFFYRPLVEGNVVVEGSSLTEIENLTYGKEILDRLYVSDSVQTVTIPYILRDQNNLYSRSGKLTVTVSGNPNYVSTPFASASDYYDYSYDSLWPVASDITAYDNTGDLIQPVLTTEAGNNNSYLNLIYVWPISPPSGLTTFVGTITDISIANPAVVTTQDGHGLSSGTQVLLQNVEGMSNFFNESGSKEYYAWVLSTTTFALYWDNNLINSLDTTSLDPFTGTSATIITISNASQLVLEYKVDIIS
jgi:hypothetical protein